VFRARDLPTEEGPGTLPGTTALTRVPIRYGSLLNGTGDDVVAQTDDVAADLATMIRWAVEKICRPAALAAIAGMLGESRQERSARSARSAAAAMASRQVAERIERAQAAGQSRADADPAMVALVLDGVRTAPAGEARIPCAQTRSEPSEGGYR
jgi:hypothetical protein